MRSPRLDYVPYHELAGRPNVVVDGSATEGTVLTLSHWPNSPCPPELAADLSAEIAFGYLDTFDLHAGAGAVSNNHFDQDGLVSIFALTDPPRALERRRVLVDVARAGDFARYESRDAARVSMVLSRYADPDRSPLGGWDRSGAYPGNRSYLEWTGLLYGELLGRLAELCDDVASYEEMWSHEDSSLRRSEELISAGRVDFEDVPGLDLVVLHVPEDAPSEGGHLFAGSWRRGLHPMAIHNAVDRFTILVVRGHRYDLYYRYESWVMYQTRRPRPRVDLGPLAEELNGIESLGTWKADAPGALTPALGTIGGAESSIAPEELVERVKTHLATAPQAWDPYPDQARAGTADT